MAFGFHYNDHTTDPDKAVIFSEAISPSAGPAASLHLFYSVARAKEMVAQLQAAIAQAEGDSAESNYTDSIPYPNNFKYVLEPSILRPRRNNQ